MTITDLDRQKAGQTAEAIEDLLAALEDVKISAGYGTKEHLYCHFCSESMEVVNKTPHPLQETLLNDLVEALREVERGGTTDDVYGGRKRKYDIGHFFKKNGG